MNFNYKKLIGLLLLTTVVLSTACDNSEFREQIGEFQKAMNDSRSAVEVYYQEMNQFEKDLYLLRREMRPDKTVDIVYDGKLGPKPPVAPDVLYINGPFPPASIQARLDALKLINLYGTRLAELAGSDSGAVFESSTAALGNNIVHLGSTFSQLANGPDKTAVNYVGPVSKLVGLVGRLFIERKRDRALIEAVREATPLVTQITSRLKKDFEDVISPARRTGLEGTISAIVQYYEVERVKATNTRKDRKAILAELNGAMRSYELFIASNPADMAQSMEDANQALLAYANSGRKKADFAQVVARIGEFRDRAQEVVAQVKEIQDIRRKLRDEDR